MAPIWLLDRDQAPLLAPPCYEATGPGSRSEAVSAGLAVSFDDAALVELAPVAGPMLSLNRFCSALDLPSSREIRRRLADAGWKR